MKKILWILIGLTPSCYAAKDIMGSLYMAERLTSKPLKRLSMIGEFGFLLADGNTNTSTVTAKLNADQELERWSYQIIGDGLYKQSEGLVEGLEAKVTSAQKLFVSGQLSYKLANPNDRLFIYSEYENRRFSGFKYQSAVAMGWSSPLWKSHSSELRYSLGPGYAKSRSNEDSNNTEQNGLIVRVAIEYKRGFSEQAAFRQFFSAEVDRDFSKTKSETSLSTKLNGALSMKLSFVVNHDTSVDRTRERLDTETAITLIYQFF
jgi:putative salt-induced outer membrane protein YdiY